MNPHQATYDLWFACGDVIDGGGKQEEIDALFSEAEGYRPFMRAMRCDGILSDKTLDGTRKLRGWLGAHMEKMGTESARTINNNAAAAYATASIDATFNSTMSQMWALPDDALGGEQKQELAKMLQEVEDSKGDEGKLKEAAKAVADWLFDHAVKAIPTVMPYITQAIGSIAG